MVDDFISLGWYCGVAASMSKYGLRSFSGPFDWYFSDFDSIIKTLDNDFIDFLMRENQEIEPDGKTFHDKKYGFIFNHELSRDFEEEYEDVYSKYSRRIDLFRTKIAAGKVCFLRAVKTQDEIKYITSNSEYINTVIKRKNIENQIIYLVPQSINIPLGFKQRYYVLDIKKYESGNNLHNLFDTNQEFISFCVNNYCKESRKENEIFNLKKINKKLQRDYEIVNARYQLLLKLECVEWDKIQLEDNIIIYGIGNIGKCFYKKIKNRSKVTCFIDSYLYGQKYDGIPILESKSLLNMDHGTSIVVTPTYDFENICSKLREIVGNNMEIKSLEDLL